MKVALVIAATALLVILFQGSAKLVFLIGGGFAVAFLLFRGVIKDDAAEGWRRVAIWSFVLALPAGAYALTGEFTRFGASGWMIPAAFVAAIAIFILAMVKRAKANRPRTVFTPAPSTSREPSIDEEVRRFQNEIRAEELANENEVLRRRLATQEARASMPEDPAADEPPPHARA